MGLKLLLKAWKGVAQSFPLSAHRCPVEKVIRKPSLRLRFIHPGVSAKRALEWECLHLFPTSTTDSSPGRLV